MLMLPSMAGQDREPGHRPGHIWTPPQVNRFRGVFWKSVPRSAVGPLARLALARSAERVKEESA